MSKWMSLDEAYDTGFREGRKNFKPEMIEKCETDDEVDDLAEYILDGMDESEAEPYNDDTATNKEIKEYESGFMDGFYEGYKEHMGESNDNPSDEDDDDEDDGEAEEVK